MAEENSALRSTSITNGVYIPSVSQIEQQYVNMNASTSFISNKQHKNYIVYSPLKKRVRRRNRSKQSTANVVTPDTYEKPPNVQDSADMYEKPSPSIPDSIVDSSVSECDSCSLIAHLLNEMKITAIKSHATGCVLRIKERLHKRINTKFFNYLNESNLNDGNTLCCNCNCHTKEVKNVSNFRDNDKFAVETTGVSNCIVKSTESIVNGLNLQLKDVKNNLQRDISTKTLKKRKRPKREKRFPIKECSFAEVQHALCTGQLIQGTVRINARNFREAYVTSTNDGENDYYLPTILDRNRALEGDIVAIKLKPKEEWTERLKTAYVVQILEEVHPRTTVGFLQPFAGNDQKFAAFIPRDMRVPKMLIPMKMCPPGFSRNSHRYENILYKGRVVDWTDIKYARGELQESLGYSGDLESETYAILADLALDITPFKPDILKSLNISDSIPIEEFAYRADLRKECIFTIDPRTARDLDDAVSCKELANGNLEIGVHISDVSFYVTNDSPLDKIVRKKATTIYMVNNVYHMLPQELCLHCSLLPGKDKLAFSVFWEITKSGEILSTRFTRSIINSCVQLSYEHAQAMIENSNPVFDDGLPQIYGGFTQEDLSTTINHLQRIAVILRKRRFENGALRIDQTKLSFRIDEVTGDPLEFFVYEIKEANRLIEEFMLLANISVAIQIANTYPDISFLRCHDSPKMHMLVELQKTLKKFDIELDISSSKNLQSSMWDIGEMFGVAQMAVLNHLLAKPMTRARYICSGDSKNEDFSHYALSVPIYTHFTSPIRRYADIMVHRLLAAHLRYAEKPKWNRAYVTLIANNCNKQKYSAKCAGEASCDLYLAHYIAEHQPFVRDAVVIDIKNTSFDVLVFSTGSIIKLFSQNLGKDIDCDVHQEDIKKLSIVFHETDDLPESRYEVKLFSVVQVALQRKPKTIKLEATLVRPISSHIFLQ